MTIRVTALTSYAATNIGDFGSPVVLCHFRLTTEDMMVGAGAYVPTHPLSVVPLVPLLSHGRMERVI